MSDIFFSFLRQHLCTAQDGLELANWEWPWTPESPASTFLVRGSTCLHAWFIVGVELRASHTLGKHSPSQATSSALARFSRCLWSPLCLWAWEHHPVSQSPSQLESHFVYSGWQDSDPGFLEIMDSHCKAAAIETNLFQVVRRLCILRVENSCPQQEALLRAQIIHKAKEHRAPKRPLVWKLGNLKS